MKDKTIDEVLADQVDPVMYAKPFAERAKLYEDAIKPICDKYGVLPWAGLQSSNEIIAAVPQLKDLFEKK